MMVVTWLYLALYLGWGVAMLTGVAARGAVNDLLFLPLYMIPALTAFRAARACGGEARLSVGLKLVALAWLTSGLAALVWCVNRAWPLEALDTAAWSLYNVYYPLTIAALWHLVELPRSGLARARLILEGVIVVVATSTLAWYSVFRFGTATQTARSIASRVGILSSGELLVVFGAALLVARSVHRGERAWPTWLALGVFVGAVGDFAYDHSKLIGTGWSGPAGDMLLALAATLVTTAGLGVEPRDAAEGEVPLPAVTTGLSLLPYAAIAVVATLLVGEFWRRQVTGPMAGLILGGGGLMALVIGRLLIAQREFAHEAAARAAQDARFRSLVHRSSDAILVVDSSGRIFYASPAFGRMVGMPDAELADRRLSDLVAPTLVETLAETSSASGIVPERWRLGAGAACREVEAIATDLRADPSVGGIVVNLRDVTERVQLEAQLRQAQKLEVVGRLASSIAHDFNNVLTVVLGNVRMAELTGRGHHADEWEAVGSAAERGAALARQLLAIGRPTPVRPRTMDLAQEVRGIEKTLRSVLPSSLSVHVTTPDAPVIVRIDEVQVEQVLLNLALNARDAMPQGGRLAIDVCALQVDSTGFGLPSELTPGTWACVRVADTGLGMPPEILERAFEPFFTTKSLGMGTGLGLPTVRDIMAGAGGQVTLASRVHEGTTVTLYLPVTESALPTVKCAPTASRTPGRGRVLVVDDEAAVRDVLDRYLTQAGFRVSTACDGVDALAVLDTLAWQVDLVLTDLVMPRMTGQELVHRLQTLDPGLAILCMSGTPGAMSDCDAPWSSERMLPKPLYPEVAAARIAEALMTAATIARS